jgi:hypothetical protein
MDTLDRSGIDIGSIMGVKEKGSLRGGKAEKRMASDGGGTLKSIKSSSERRSRQA